MQLRTVVVRETDGILRQATWEERDRMYQAFFPTIGRKMWLPKALSTDVLPSTLNNMLHLNVLDLVCVQCDPQSHDYHRVSALITLWLPKGSCVPCTCVMNVCMYACRYTSMCTRI